jgi:glycosyltransferase involved in cell wall biosynthesis
LFVGGHFQRKGGDLLLDVFRAHLRGRATLELVTRDAIADEAGVRVHRGLTPESPQLRELYRDASVFVLPTRGDCFSIASMEAMATGLPVVVSDVGGIAEIVEEGRSGYLMPVNDGRALRESLERLLADAERRRAFGARGRELVNERFDAEKTARQLLEIMTEVARPT